MKCTAFSPVESDDTTVNRKWGEPPMNAENAETGINRQGRQEKP
jgi:hypothetical protein